MIIDVKVVIGILIIHWIADFVCQTDWQVKNKSKSNKALYQHVLWYTGIWLIPSLFLVGYQLHWFLLITFICHFVTDYFTSRINSKLWTEGKVHYFFVSIGFDQILHYVQLFLTYYVLK